MAPTMFPARRVAASAVVISSPFVAWYVWKLSDKNPDAELPAGAASVLTCLDRRFPAATWQSRFQEVLQVRRGTRDHAHALLAKVAFVPGGPGARLLATLRGVPGALVLPSFFGPRLRDMAEVINHDRDR